MTGDVINLRHKRKAKARSLQTQKAAENRALFGRPKAERLLDKAEAARADKVHEGHKLSSDTEDPL